ncbi:FAST kinase domain-containing protein 2-like [Scleropages formosus]|uniref:FAST kinase domain-containing protein 2-like n=1 Tax=Scleropages formosus TaxID=113540 RepID=A0A0P7UN84_SCLFO|nr:FAST kinase domain-containing protein 2-like [Scleropages formosus]
MVRFYTQGEAGSSVQSASENVGGAPEIQISPVPGRDFRLEHHLDVKAEPQVSFYNQLQACCSPVDVLDLCGQHTMTWKRMSYTLGRTWDALKAIPEEQRSYQLQLVYEHPAFEKLCMRLMHESPQMKHSDVTHCLLALVKLGVSQRSRVVQTLLRAAQEKLNDFDERSLSVLASSLEVMQSCQNVDALKKGLKVPAIQNVEALQSLMRCVGKDAPKSLKRKLEEKALSMTDQFTLPNSQYMFITLAAMNFFSKPLLNICKNKIIENIEGVPFSRLMLVLKACKTLQYRDHLMLSSVAEHWESTFDMWNHKQLVTLLLIFEELGFRPASLMDKISEKVVRDSASLTKWDLQSLLKTYSSLNHIPQLYKKEFLDSMTNLLESYLPKMTPLEILKCVYFLCVLGHFPSAPFEKLLSEETLHEFLSKDGDSRKEVEWRLHSVDLCLRFDRPPLLQTVTVPAGATPGHPTCLTRSIGKEIIEILQSISGDSAVQEGVLLENSYFLDCAVMLPLSGLEVCAPADEEPSTPKQCHRLAVLNVSPSSFCLGTQHPRGKLALKLRHLKALGYSPILVSQSELERLSQEEREKLLRRLVLGVREEVPSVFERKEPRGQESCE